ncbi:MAG TPA: hypothetical protein VIU13_12975 [Chryseolinea sp.]
MTNQQPDKFFREKLADYHKPAPAGAWDRIESSLKKTEPRFAWWKVAASLLLLTAIAYVLWLQTSGPTTQPISQARPEIESPRAKSIEPQIDASEKSQNTDELQAEQAPIEIAAKDKKSSDNKVSPKQIRAHKKNGSETASLVPSTDEKFQSVETSSPETVSSQVVPSVQPIKKSPSIKMTITVEETDKYLDKNALAEATSKERKSSTFKKLLKRANELTTNQDPFGDLRVKKNEILALEFRNDKRGQNK